MERITFDLKCPYCGSNKVYWKRTIDIDNKDVEIFHCPDCQLDCRE